MILGQMQARTPFCLASFLPFSWRFPAFTPERPGLGEINSTDADFNFGSGLHCAIRAQEDWRILTDTPMQLAA